MKSTIVFFCGLLALLACLSACKKTADARPIEMPFSTYLSSPSSVTTGVRSSGPWELGIVFSASVAGKITQVGSKMPEAGSYRIIIWDFDTKAVLRQKTVEQSTPDKLAMEGIDALPLTTDKKYVISINSQSGGVNKKYGVAYKTGGSEFMPFAKGNILVQNACYSGVATPTFPTAAQNVKYELYGFPEFAFQPD